MGSASNYFNDLEDKRQVQEWRELVYLVAKRYIGEWFLLVHRAGHWFPSSIMHVVFFGGICKCI